MGRDISAEELTKTDSIHSAQSTHRYKRHSMFTFFRLNVMLVSGSAVLLFILILLIAAPILFPHPNTGDLVERLIPPVWMARGSFRHIFGTDQLGRGIFSRTVWGGRISVLVGTVSSLMSMGIGMVLGIVSGYFRGKLDYALARFADMLMAFPFLLFAIGMISILGPGFMNSVLALSFKGWVEFYRLARSSVVEEHSKEYVEAAISIGASPFRIMASQILRNIWGPIFALWMLRIGTMIVLESSLSFLGLGIQPPTPDWGRMISTGSDYLYNGYWISVLPGIALIGTVLTLNVVGEGLRAHFTNTHSTLS